MNWYVLAAVHNFSQIAFKASAEAQIELCLLLQPGVKTEHECGTEPFDAQHENKPGMKAASH